MGHNIRKFYLLEQSSEIQILKKENEQNKKEK